MRQAKRDGLMALIAATDAANYTRIDRRAIEKHVRARLADWRGLLTENVQDGRDLLRQVPVGPFRFTPQDHAYRFEGEAAMGRLSLRLRSTYLCGVPKYSKLEPDRSLPAIDEAVT